MNTRTNARLVLMTMALVASALARGETRGDVALPPTAIRTEGSQAMAACPPDNPYGWSYRGECTWYVYARILELVERGFLDPSAADGLPTGHARHWADSYHSTEWFDTNSACLPQSWRRPGLIACWQFGEHGHVAFLEEVSEDRTKYRVSDFNRNSDSRYEERWYYFDGGSDRIGKVFPLFYRLPPREGPEHPPAEGSFAKQDGDASVYLFQGGRKWSFVQRWAFFRYDETQPCADDGEWSDSTIATYPQGALDVYADGPGVFAFGLCVKANGGEGVNGYPPSAVFQLGLSGEANADPGTWRWHVFTSSEVFSSHRFAHFGEDADTARENTLLVPPGKIDCVINHTFGGEGVPIRETVTVAGRVVNEQGAAMPGVSVDAAGEATVVTNADGGYTLVVPMFWRGAVTPSKQGLAFTPATVSLPRVTDDIHSIDFTASRAPVLQVAPKHVTVTCCQGETATCTIIVSNAGDGALDFTTQSSASWLSVEPRDGSCGTEGGPLVLQFDATALAPGTYQGSVTLRSGDTENGPQTVSASLTVIPVAVVPSYALTVGSEGEGSVRLNPAEVEYQEGTLVILTAEAAQGHVFAQWSGSIPTELADDNPLTLTMDSDRTIQAHFVPDAASGGDATLQFSYEDGVLSMTADCNGRAGDCFVGLHDWADLTELRWRHWFVDGERPTTATEGELFTEWPLTMALDAFRYPVLRGNLVAVSDRDGECFANVLQFSATLNGVEMTPDTTGTWEFDLAAMESHHGPGPTDLPHFTQHPMDRTVNQGETVVLTCFATSPLLGGLAYQWQRNGTELPGQTGDSLRITSAQLSDTGEYAVVAWNAVGAIVSDVAVLTVLEPEPPEDELAWSLRIGLENAQFSELVFGVHPDATNGYDTGLDVACPPSGHGSTYLGFAGSAGLLACDFRGTGDALEFLLRVTMETGAPLNLSWCPEDVPAGLWLVEEDHAGNPVPDGVALNMTETAALTVSGLEGHQYRFRISDVAAQTFELQLRPGCWNLISLPLNPVNPGIATLFGDGAGATVWRWDATTQKYVFPDSEGLTAGVGYWIYLTEGMASSIPVLGWIPADTARLVPQGWNLLGPVLRPPYHDGELAFPPRHEPAGKVGLGSGWLWDAEEGKYVPADSIIPAGAGFWLHADGECTLDLRGD